MIGRMPKLGRPPGSRDRSGRANRVDLARIRAAYRELCAATGARLRQLREERDVSADELALAIDVCRMTVLAWERGRSAPSLVCQLAISWALTCTLADLLPDQAHHR